MANVQESPEEIQRRMAEIRSRLHHEMSGFVGGASATFDWRSYVRGRPWLSLGIAFAAGYLVVPRRRRITVPDIMDRASTLAETIPSRDEPRGSWTFQFLRAAGGFVAPIALRAAQAYVLRAVEDFLVLQPDGPAGPRTRNARSEPISASPAGRPRGADDARRLLPHPREQ